MRATIWLTSALPLLAVAAAACEESVSGRDGSPPAADAVVAETAPDGTGGDGTGTDGTGTDGTGTDGTGGDASAADQGSNPNPNLDKLLKLPADSWYTASGTKLRAVCAPKSFGVDGVSGCGAIVNAWGGGAYDAKGRRLFIWGGGHNDYWGNELYAFDLAQLKWARLTDPSPGPFNKDPLDDGNPVSRHTYDGLQFIDHAARFFGQGGSRAKDGNGTRLTWIFDPATKKWTNMKPAGKDYPGLGHPYNMSSGYEPASKQLYMRDPYNLYAYDYDKNTWTKKLAWAHAWGAQTGAVDTKRRLFFSLGSKELLVYDIAANKDVTKQWSTTGGSVPINAGAPGVAYDSKADALVAFTGGGVWVLDPQTKAWTKKGQSGAPASAVSNGTYGRWRYVAEVNVFVLVNSVDKDVVFYKHTK